MSDTTMDIGLNFEADQARIKKLTREMQQQFALGMQSAIQSGMKTGLSYDKVKQNLGGLQKGFQQAMENANRNSISTIKQLHQQMMSEVAATSDREEKERIKARFTEQIKYNIDKFKHEQKLAQDIAKGQVTELQKGYDEINKEMKGAMDEAGKGLKKHLQDGFKTLGSLGGNIKSLNFKGIGGDIGSLIKQGGKAGGGRLLKQAKIAKAAGNAKAAKAMMLAGKGMMMASAGLAAAVVGIAAIVALIAKAIDSQRKMNKEIFEQASVMEVASGSANNLARGLREIRKVATDIGLTMQYGIKSKDVMEFIGAISNANLTLKEFHDQAEDGVTSVEHLRQTMIGVTGVARMLGVKSNELAGALANLADEQGGSLKFQAEQMAILAQTAQNSGFQQKYFYQTVLESTSGMALYNKRVAEAGNLLVQLGKILGTKMAADTLKELGQGFKSESTAESYKRVLKTGRKTTQDIFKREAQVASQQFLNTMSGDGKKGLEAAFGVVGSSLDLGGNAQENANALSKALSGMSTSQQEKLIGEMIANKDISREQVRQISNLVDLSQASKGNSEKMAMAMDELGPSGTLLMQLKGLQGIVGDIPFHRMTSIQQQMLAEAQGYSREQVEKLKEISMQAHAQYGKLQELRNVEETKRMDRVDQVKQFGAFIDENGEIISARLDKTGEIIDENSMREVKSAEELVALQMAYEQKEIKPAMDEAEYWAREQAMATVTLSDIMEQAILKVLEEIANLMVPLVAWLTGGLTEEERQAKQEAMLKLQEKKKDARDKAIEKSKDIKHYDKIAQTSTGEKKKAAEKKRDQAKLDRTMLEHKQKGLSRQSRSIEAMNYRDTTFGAGIYEFFGADAGENAIARTRLDSADDFIAASEGRGVDTGLTFGEKAALVAGGTLLGGGLGGFGVVGAGGVLTTTTAAAGGGGAVGGIALATGGDYIAEGDPQNLDRVIAELGTEQKKVFDEIKGGGFGDQEALDALYGYNNEAAQYYVKKQLADEQQKEETRKTTEAVEDVKKSIEESNAGAAFAQLQVAKDAGYTGGTGAQALQELGKGLKAQGKSKSEVEKLLEQSGFDSSQKAQILGGMTDGFAFFNRGNVSVVPIASQDDAKLEVGRRGGALEQLSSRYSSSGNTFNFYGGSTAEIIAHFENLQSQGIV